MIKLIKKLWMDIAVFALIASCIGYMHLCNGWNCLGLFWLCEFCTFILFDTTVLILGTYVLSLGYKRIAYTFAFHFYLAQFSQETVCVLRLMALVFLQLHMGSIAPAFIAMAVPIL